MKISNGFWAIALALTVAACSQQSSNESADAVLDASDVAGQELTIDSYVEPDLGGQDLVGRQDVPSDLGADSTTDASNFDTAADVAVDAQDVAADMAEVDSTLPLVCEPGTENCDGDLENRCEAVIGSIEHCAGCNDACSKTNALPECVAGACLLTCTAGWGDCNEDVADGCEQSLLENGSCGQCGKTCPGICVAGSCTQCDAGLALDSSDPLDALKAMGICEGVVSAKWVLPDGADPQPATLVNYDLGHGILSGFGPNVPTLEGGKLLSLSSGTARTPTDPGYSTPGGFNKQYASGAPAGFPMESPACPGVVTGQPYDGIALEVTLQVPDFVVGYSFASNFYTYEWPAYICSSYNDFFVVLQSPMPAGMNNGNVVFDAMGNPISVNSAFMQVCGCEGGPPCVAGGVNFECNLGTSMLVGTGFGNDGMSSDHAATGWLRTTSPVQPGSQITLRFTIYDSGDGILDSTVLLDSFQWIVDPVVLGTNPL